jgi:hypothetical protein
LAAVGVVPQVRADGVIPWHIVYQQMNQSIQRQFIAKGTRVVRLNVSFGDVGASSLRNTLGSAFMQTLIILTKFFFSEGESR